MTRRWRWAGLVLLVLLLCVACWLWLAAPPPGAVKGLAGPTVTASVRVSPGRPESPPVAAPPPAPPTGALQAIAEVTGRTVFECPAVEGDHTYAHPLGAICGVGKGARCAVAEPAGAIVVMDSERVPTGALRWWTDEVGVTRCVLEPTGDFPARVRVVDRAGKPVAGAWVLAGSVTGTTGRDGETTLHLYANAPTLATAHTETAMTDDEIAVVPGALTVMRLERTDLPPEEAVRRFALDSRYEDVVIGLEDLRATIERGRLTPDALVELQAQVEMLTSMAENACDSEHRPRQCPAATRAAP